MTTQQTRTHRPDPDAVEVREPSGAVDSSRLFRIRMPVTSTAEARDGEAFDDDKIDGFRQQIEESRVPVFLDHGRNETTGSRYSALGKIGYLAEPALMDRNGQTELDADFVVIDPSELDADVGQLRNALATIREQAEIGIPLASSIGWSEDTGDRNLPGEADLLEASIVGIPSDARTTTASAEPEAMARAVSAATSDFDVETFVRELQQSTHNVVDVNGEEIDLTPPQPVANAATLALSKDDEFEPDCGTGAGRQSARDIAGDDITAERIDDIAAYLTSHEEDVTADGPPSDWDDDEWQDCGNLQYALWGGLGTGTGLEWSQSKANEVAAAKDEELPYDRTEDDVMSDTDTEPDEESGTETDEQERMGADEFREQMLEMQEEQTDMLRAMKESAMDGDDEDGDDDEDDEEENSAEPDAANDADDDTADERTISIDGEETTVEEARERLSDLQSKVDETDPDDIAEPQTTDRADKPDDEESDESEESANIDWRA